MEEYDLDYEGECPKGRHSPIHYKDCSNFCEDGYIDESEDDPINFMPGESLHPCSDCRGTGVEVWCPGCGAKLIWY